MCDPDCLHFAERVLSKADIEGKDVIEVGSMDVNGSVRPIIGQLGPKSYLGVDVVEGPGVDEICNSGELLTRFGPESFDVVATTEMLEHVRDWQETVSGLKRILRKNGVLLLTTRSRGFPYHAFPFDFWRFELDDMRAIFSDMEIEALERDTSCPGVFIKARKPEAFEENSLDDYSLYCIAKLRRCKKVNAFEYFLIEHVCGWLLRVLPKGFRTKLQKAIWKR